MATTSLARAQLETNCCSMLLPVSPSTYCSTKIFRSLVAAAWGMSHVTIIISKDLFQELLCPCLHSSIWLKIGFFWNVGLFTDFYVGVSCEHWSPNITNKGKSSELKTGTAFHIIGTMWGEEMCQAATSWFVCSYVATLTHLFVHEEQWQMKASEL